MIDKRNSISYMKEYLKHAVIFERYVYIWENTMNEVNKHMRNIYNKKESLTNAIASNDNKSCSTGFNTVSKEEYARHCKKQGKTDLVVSIVMLLLIAVVYVGMAISINNDLENKGVIILILDMLTGLFALIGFIFFILFIFNMRNYNKIKKEMNSSIYHQENPQQKKLRLTNDLATIKNQESILASNQDEIFKNLNVAKNNRAKLYSENILPEKYRSYSAVATLYEYLETGRCNTIQGHGGIYDTYEVDFRQGLIIENLREINQRLKNIESNQRLLYQEMRQANNTLSYINANLYEIKRSNEQIVKNTAISAVANQQAAASAQYVAWQMGQTVF